MRLFSVLLLLAMMTWTYCLSRDVPAVSHETHGVLVKELKSLMAEYLNENVSGIQNITFYRMYTEVVKPNQEMKAFTKYSYESKTETGALTKELREGEFLLVSSDGGKTWQPKATEFRDVNLEFLEELKIVPSTKESLQSPETQEHSNESSVEM